MYRFSSIWNAAEVVLPAIVIVVLKNSLAEVGIVEDESAKVTPRTAEYQSARR